MITLGQIMGTQIFGFCFMGLMISGPIYAVIHEIYFNNGYSKVKPRDEIV